MPVATGDPARISLICRHLASVSPFHTAPATGSIPVAPTNRNTYEPQDESAKQMAVIREWGDQFVLPIPKVRVS